MNASDQMKLCKQGFTIIRRNDYPTPRITYKNDVAESWRTLEKFKSKAERDRYAKRLLTQKDVIED